MTHINPNMREIDVQMKQSKWNQNYVGTMFGGSLFSMTDPFYMLMLLENLGKEYIVWDKAAAIRFRKPGKGRVTAQFRLDEETLNQCIQMAAENDRYEPDFTVNVVDDQGDTVAEVVRTLYIKRKDKIKK